MIDNARAWLALLGPPAAAIAAVICLTNANAVAEPMPAPVPTPAPPAQTAPVVPMAATAPAPPALLPATSGTLTDYFKDKNVTLEPQRAQGFQAFNITLPMPPGWSQVPDPNVPDAFGVIANRNSPDLYTPNAQVVIYRLVGNFDPKEAITHGFVDSQSLAAWQGTNGSLADFGGFPSSIIEGTYRQNDMTLNTSRRHVIATSGPDKYLVSLSVTYAAATQGAPATAEAADAIVTGFSVTPTTPGAPPLPTP